MAERSHKRSPLTAEELEAYQPPAPLASFLDRHSCARILDWGCGRGELVFWMRRRGFDAWGMDVESAFVSRGRAGFETLDEPPEVLLTTSEFAALPSGHFDVLVSNMVLEHLRDLAASASTMRRALRTGGVARHLYPGRWRPIEPHVGLPIVHWFPQRLRLRTIAMLLRFNAGAHARWPGLEGADRDEVAGTFDRYLDSQTFYRSNRAIVSAFRRAGFDASIDVADHRLRPWLPGPVGAAIIPRALTVHLDLRAI